MNFDEMISDDFSKIIDCHHRILSLLGMLIKDLSKCEALCIRIACDHYGIEFEEMSFLLSKGFFMDKINVAKRVAFKCAPDVHNEFDEKIRRPAERVNSFRNDLIHGLHLGPANDRIEVARPKPLFDTWDDNVKNVTVSNLISNIAVLHRVESELVRLSTISGAYSVSCHYEIGDAIHFVTFEHGQIMHSIKREAWA